MASLDLSDIPFDFYNAEFKDKDWNEVKCPFCNVYCVSKAAMLRHRRSLHYNQRTPKDANIDIDAMIKDIELEQMSFIKTVMLHDHGKYLCHFTDNRLLWVALSKNHVKVQEYEDYLKNKPQPPTKDGLLLVNESNSSTFLNSPFIFDEVEKEMESTTIPLISTSTNMPVIIPLPNLQPMDKKTKQISLNVYGLPSLE
eukprot:362173_1